jgi:thiaminase/transcriptional activator TenA
MSFSSELWRAAQPIYDAILRHPFVHGLTTGALDEAAFRYYVIQDSHYLRDFARGLALLGAKADREQSLEMFCQHATNAIAVERALHESFYGHWGLSEQQVWATPVAPNCLLYTSYLVRVAYERPYYEGVAAFLPCYWVYLEVGKALERQGSPNPRFQQWIATYASAEFETVVKQVIAATDALAATLTPAQRAAMTEHFVMATRFEWMFWDMGFRQQRFEV